MAGQPLIQQPANHKTQIETLLKKVAFHTDNHAATPYRKAVDHLKQSLEAAKRGESPVVQVGHETPVVVRPVAVGERVPDFVVSSMLDNQPVRYQKAGRPTLLVFYNPASGSAEELLRFDDDTFYEQWVIERLSGVGIFDAPPAWATDPKWSSAAA